MPLWSVGGRQSQRGAVLSQARTDPLLTPHWAPSSPLGSSVCCRVRQAMGLCGSFSVADFKPIWEEKIGLAYQPLFIVHILFVNPTNYIFSCYRSSFFTHFLSIAHTYAHKNNKTKVTATWESNTAGNTGTVTVGYKMPTSQHTNKGTALHSESNGFRAAGGWSHGIKSRRQSYCYILTQNTILFLSLPNTHTHICSMTNCPLV